MKRVLILGGGVMQVPAIRIARGKGWTVAVADGNPHALARDTCDRFETIDLKDKEGIAELARRLSADGGLDGVFTAGTDFSTTVAWVCERLGLPGVPYATALAATDKLLMRQRLQAAGVPGPRFSGWSGEGDPGRAAATAGAGFPLVVKPVDNMGARGVRRVSSPQDLPGACEAARAASRTGRVIIEEYMDGPELSLDAVVYRGEITVCGVADREICFPPFFVEMGHTMPSARSARDLEGAVEVFRAGIRALGIDNGAAKGDIKLTRDGPRIGEIAARLSGGYMSGWTYPYSSGVEVTEAALNVAVGLPPGDLSPRWRKVSAERAFLSVPGEVEGIRGVEEARGLPGVRDVFLRVRAGDRVVFPTNNVEKCGNVITCDASRRRAVAQAEAALCRIRISLAPRRAETDRFLFGGGEGREAPAAFWLEDRGNLAALSVMPAYMGGAGPGSPETPVPVMRLPAPARETCRDWHGLSLKETLRSLEEEGLIRFPSDPREERLVLGRLFWSAVLRGGRQGAEYLVRSFTAPFPAEETARYIGSICAP
jgi:biotin carboxylase